MSMRLLLVRSWVRVSVGILGSVAALVPGNASAQGVFDSVGVRALGMGGAFVAVADDATAVHWNPAGLSGGPTAGLTIGWHRFQVGNPDGPISVPGSHGRTSLTSVGAWPIGVSYGTYERQAIVSGATNTLEVRRLSMRHAGLTVLQSVGDSLVVGSTFRLLRAESASAPAGGGSLAAALERGRLADSVRRTALDLDVGALATVSRVRVGFTWKNLRSLSVGATPGSGATLPRQARIGLSVLPAHGLTLAMDLELNTVDLMGDLRRMSALGAEISLGSRFLVRSGVRWNLAISSGPAGAMGASVRVRRGFWLDAHYAPGGTGEANQVSVALRASP